MAIKIPQDFDGQKFINKFGVGLHDFRVDENGLHCPSLPNLTEADIADCVTDWDKYYAKKPHKAPISQEDEFQDEQADEYDESYDEDA
jgi:hypothetical protein